MQNKPLVSIVVPVFNAEMYLEKCLGSITKQEYPNLEVIVVNDGSSDASGEIIESYALNDSRYIVYNQKNRGVSAARNKGISLAKGDYVTFIDADDVIHKVFIRRLVNDLLEKNADIVTTNKQSYSMTDSEFLSISLGNDAVIQEYTVDQALMSLYSGTLEKGHNGVQMLRRRLIIDNNLLYDTSMKICEDFDFLARAIVESNKVIYDPLDMYYYRLNDFSALQTMTVIQHYESMHNKQLYGRKLVKDYPDLEKILNNNLLLESISCGGILINLKERYPSEFMQVTNNINTYKHSTLFSKRISLKNRLKVLIIVVLGNIIGLHLANKLSNQKKAMA